MKKFFADDILLKTETSKVLYNSIKDLPIIDYHCHLDSQMIEEDAKFNDIGELWLKGDHYKWRAMRLLNVDESYITGDKSFKEKFFKYCEIMPSLMGNPLYYWSHLELKQLFNINVEINKDNAEFIYNEANKKLSQLSVRKMLKQYNVKFVATTNDPLDDLKYNKVIDGITVSPTFRPDKLLALDVNYLNKLSKTFKVKLDDLESLERLIIDRLDYFKSKGCVISDHGFDDFPARIASRDEAKKLYNNLSNLNNDDKDALRGYLFIFLLKEYKKRNIVVQLHFSVIRNINTNMFDKLGVDSGFDVIYKQADENKVINFLNYLSDNERPVIILYSLNPNFIKTLSCISGAFRNVYIGAAWWFNDTLNGIKENLEIVSEYAAIGNNLGMLTDSRSFSSYSRFDFFRRILSDFVGDKIESGQYTLQSGETLVKNIALYNIKNLLSVKF